MYDEVGNVIDDQIEMMNIKRNQKQTYFIFKSWSMPIKQYIYILLVLLAIALFMERYCFVVAVYKTKNYGYVLVLTVIFFNSLFLFLISKLRKKKHKKRLHELYNVDRTPSVGFCVICLVGCIDILKSFFLFWPANVMPLWLLVCML